MSKICPMCKNEKEADQIVCDKCYEEFKQLTGFLSRPPPIISIGRIGMPPPFLCDDCKDTSDDNILNEIKRHRDKSEKVIDLFPGHLEDFGLGDLSGIAKIFFRDGVMPHEFLSMVIIKELRLLKEELKNVTGK